MKVGLNNMDKIDNSSEIFNKDDLSSLSSSLGADKTAFVKTENINFSIDFKDMCAMNSCGKYNTNWMCPPGVGKIEDGIARIKQYNEGMIIQTITQLEDSFDFEGMQDAATRHDKVFRDVIQEIKSQYKTLKIMALSVGGCSLCDRCSYLDNLPCIQPERALSSVEAYGIDVNNLLTVSGLKYNNGVSTVSYVGLILF